MKKNLTIILLAISLNINFFAQEAKEEIKESKLTLGIENGLTLNKFRTSGYMAGYGFDNKLSYVGGITASYYLFKFLSLKASLNFENKGAKFTYSSFYGSYFDAKYNLNYLNLPIVVSYHYNLSKINLHAGLGPNLGFLLFANGSISGQSESITSSFNRIDFGLAAEIGASYEILPKILIDVSFREAFGLLNVVSDYTGGASYKTNSMGLIFGLKYKL